MSKQHYTDEDYKQLHQAHCHTESLREGLAKALVASENENARLRMVIRDILSGNAKLRPYGAIAPNGVNPPKAG